MITIQLERWAHFKDDAEALFPLHWEEVAIDKEHYKQKADHARYLAMCAAGSLQVVTARDVQTVNGKVERKLVGYIISFIVPHMHYKGSPLVSMTDMYFVLPEYRKGGLGLRLFKFMEADLKAKGVGKAHTSCKVHLDFQPFLEKMGWRFTDKTFSKMLGGK